MAATDIMADPFAGVLRTYQSMVFSIAYHFLRDRGAAEEVAQDVFLELYRRLGELAGDEHICFPDQDGPVHALEFSDDGDLVALNCPSEVRILDATSGSTVGSIAGPILSTAFLPGDRGLVTSGPKDLQVWNVDNWSEQRFLGKGLSALAVSRNGTHLAAVARGEWKYGTP